MKTIKSLILSFVLAVLMTSCATTAKFPISSVTPAAEITAKLKKDKQDNFEITITAKYMADPERLMPPKRTYVVWIATRKSGIKNIGQLNNKNAQKSTLEALSAFEPEEIFITAEEEGDISYPSGTEISRIKL
jgi:hypothetical protein